jgi:arabinofuranosyltransferase
MESPAQQAAAPRRTVAVLLVLAALWYGWFIFRTSFVAAGERVFCLFDDAMISMVYARNLAEGHGLVWAREGEPVEGFTHPLWTAVMVAVNALPLPPRLRSLPVQLLSLGLLLANVVLVRRLTLRHFTYPHGRTWLPAAVSTAFCYPLVYWSLMGMETALQAAITTASVLLALDAVERGPSRGRHLLLWLLAAAAYLVRMDMLIPVAAVQVFLLTQGGMRREERGRWLAGLGLFAAVVLGYGAFRWLYFGDLLPNTYYLKLAGVPLAVRLLRGLDVLGEFLRRHLLLLLPVGLGVAPLLARRGEARRYALPAAVFLLQCAYGVWVGGDAWEDDIDMRANRFLAFALPMVFVLGNGLLNRLLDRVPEGRRGSEGASYLVAAATAAALLVANGLWLSRESDENWRLFLATRRPEPVELHQEIYARFLELRRVAEPGAVVAVVWAGLPLYFSGGDYRMIDLLGYNDRRTARLAPQVELNEDTFGQFRPGHVKWDYERVLREQRPDVFFQIWKMKTPGKLLRPHGYTRLGELWVRRGSPRVRLPAPEAPVAATVRPRPAPAGPAGAVRRRAPLPRPARGL